MTTNMRVALVLTDIQKTLDDAKVGIKDVLDKHQAHTLSASSQIRGALKKLTALFKDCDNALDEALTETVVSKTI